MNNSNDGCVCAEGNFASNDACGSNDACASTWSPKGTCTTECSATQSWADSACTDCTGNKIANNDHSACVCTGGDNAENDDCACKENKYSTDTVAYKQACDVTCPDAPTWAEADGLATCLCADGDGGAKKYYNADGEGACADCPANSTCNGYDITGCADNFNFNTDDKTCNAACTDPKTWRDNACKCPAA